MRHLAALFSFLVLLCGLDGGTAWSQTTGGCTTPDPFALVGGGTCVNGGWLPPANPTPTPIPPSPPPTPQVIAVGEQMTGTLTFDAPETFFELIAPSDGTLVVHSSANSGVSLYIDNVLFDYWPPMVGTLPVVAGRTYHVRVVTFIWWDYQDDVLSFVYTTSLYPPGAVVPIGCTTPDPFVVLGGGTCVNGGWLAPGMAPAAPPPPPPVLPPPSPPPAGGCTTPDPFVVLGGGTCVNGGWLAPGMAPAAPPPPSPVPPPPSPPPAGGCTTPDPFGSLGGGTCVDGGWLAPGMAPAAPPPPPPVPPPPTPPMAPVCTTPDPFAGIPGLYGVCVGIMWVPFGHPLAPDASLAVTGVQPAAGTIGEWVRIFGVGFRPDTKVTFGGIAATVIMRESGGSIFALAPAHNAGPADVAVHNTDGFEATLAGAYTYQPVTIIAAPTVVSSGGEVIVTWTAPAGQSYSDWIGLFRVGEPNENYLSYEYTWGTSSGSLKFVAPLLPGQYEFRYLPNDDYYDAARSSPITVVGGSLW